MRGVRKPAVAGQFYPRDVEGLSAAIAGYLKEVADKTERHEDIPKALIVPHAGYAYSGPVAASAYARISGAAETITRVVLLGPAHLLAFEGLALTRVDGFETPLGIVPVDADALARIEHLAQVRSLPSAHEDEHSLEVQLPFLQSLLRTFSLVPLVVGAATAEQVAEVLDALWGGEETLIVVSTDLSHYCDYETARVKDAATSAAIEALDERSIGPDDACGRIPLSGLLVAARAHGMAANTVDLRNSGDTAGPRNRVVGYGAYVIG